MASAGKSTEAIGEAAGNIPRREKPFAVSHPQLPLVEAYRMRNRLSNGYDTIDWEILWDTGTFHVPSLLAAIRDLNPGDRG